MRPSVLSLLLCGLLTAASLAAPKPHVVVFGKWQPVKLPVGENEERTLDLRVRPLIVDGGVREFTTGEAHDITERLFVVRRAYRVNDGLPDELRGAGHWVWQLGGWLLVDRTSGRITALSLPEFDAYDSQATWFRDYAAYCGVSDDGDKLWAIVAQVGRRKPVVKKALGAAQGGELPGSEYQPPRWQRQPTRVTFQPVNGKSLSFEVRGRSADLITEPDASEEGSD